MNSVQIITIITAMIFLIQVVVFTRKNKLHDQHAFLWMVFGFAGLLVAFLIPQFNHIASLLGIAYMPTFVFMIAFIVVLNILMYQTTVQSTLQKKINILIQESAFHKKEIENLKKSLNKGEQE
ncbi:DUF2304 domain-containing protein [Fictibacillus nanhaiensis]|uniref:DUF2304 domain-containing protein n=1 Tax=Fictibacillus nanhaiensis TaxID=742169 RepID=UPI003C1614BE